MSTKKMLIFAIISVFLCLTFTAVSAEDITLQFWTFSEYSAGDLIEVTNIAIKEFQEEHPGVKVSVTGMGDDELLMSLTTAAMTNTMPDLFVTNAYDGAAVLSYGGIANIYDKWYAEPEEWRAQFNQTIVDYYTPKEGELYSMPYTGWAEVLYRNLTVLEEAGIDPNVPIKDWADFAAQCKQIYEKTGAYCTFNNTLTFSDFQPWYAGVATPEEMGIDFENNVTTYSADKLAQTVEFMKSIMPYCASVGNGDQASTDLFISNKMAYYLDGPWNDITFRQSDVKYDYALIPGVSEDKKGGRSGYELLAVGNGKHVDLAYELAKKIADSKSMVRWAEKEQRFFGNNIAAEAAINSGSKIMAAVMEAHKYAIPLQLPYFQQPYPGNFFAPALDYIQSALEGSVDIKEGAVQAIEEMNAILEEEY